MMHNSRRQFIKNTALLAPALAVMPSYVLKANTFLRVGFIGAGIWGKQVLQQALAHKGIAVRAICDNDPAAAKAALQLFPNAKPALYNTCEELLACKDLDAVIIAAPADQHYIIARAALLAGKHVACGPVMGRTEAEHRDIVRLSIKTGKQYFTLDEQSYRPDLLAIAAMVKEGHFGQLETVYAGAPHNNIPQQQDGYPFYPLLFINHIINSNYASLRIETRQEEHLINVTRNGKNYACLRKDEITMINLTTDDGQTVKLQTASGHSTGCRIKGTKGSWMDFTRSLHLEANAHPNGIWSPAAPYLKHYTVPQTALTDFIQAVQHPEKKTVHTAAANSMIAILACEAGQRVMTFPDFINA